MSDEGASTVWGTSFDGVPISGLVVEFLKLARCFHRREWRVHLDLGYDINTKKGNFGRHYSNEADVLPQWVTLNRVGGLTTVRGYGPSFVEELSHLVRSGRDVRAKERFALVCSELASCIASTWRDLRVRAVIVENGTLPENVAYTAALLAAIEMYGSDNRLGRYVLWRDHDLMWSSEPSSLKYGPRPYDHVTRPTASRFVQYAVQHTDVRRQMASWAPELRDIAVIPNTFDFSTPPHIEPDAFRRWLAIPAEDFLIVRTTRIIPQKRIDRDVHLLAGANAVLKERSDRRNVHLAVAGPVDECPDEHAALLHLSESLGVTPFLHFLGVLSPIVPDSELGRDRTPSVRDLLGEADLVSFLTSYEYESFGNPIGEAIAARVPYITTRYQRYDAVYGSKGFTAPIMEVGDGDRSLPQPEFVRGVVDLLLDRPLRLRIAAKNFRLGKVVLASRGSDARIASLMEPAAEFPSQGER